MKICYPVIVICLGILVFPQTRAAEKPTTETAMKTAKERLGNKYSDEQRVNNCKVPVTKRGNKPRPDRCSRIQIFDQLQSNTR